MITCNALPYPFVDPVSSGSKFTEREYMFDKEAMDARAVCIAFTKKFDDAGIDAFNVYEWA